LDGKVEKEPEVLIPAIVLAAGKSTRMGRCKAVLDLGSGQTFLSKIIGTFRDAGVADVIVVVGHDADLIRTSLAVSRAAARIVYNADYESGQFSSMLKGLSVADRPGVSAVLFTLVDVPLVASSTVTSVIERYRETGAPIVRPTRGSEHGHPVLIDRSLFDELRHANPDDGAKTVVRAHASPEGDLEIDDQGAFLDIDTAEEYQRAVRLLHR